ncbi:hypothetical protein CVT26_014397 [Gymnopilus dilepis]|uniref:Cytochrome P450 n=1 Tax=Gymnopilus dilepis TaxID=231916 RepID=A0A409Y7N4_9AGAR|nr:hypothetical protein CVT26_014397 [Gymnopilus dilepis]
MDIDRNLLGLAAAVSTCFLIWLYKKTRPKFLSESLPPGPRPLPIVGNVFDMPRKKEWETFSKWAREYGDIVFLNVAGHPVVILSSLQATTDLLLERSSIYSDRPHFPLIDLTGHRTFNFGFMSYDKDWIAHRKIFAGGFSKASLAAYHDSHRAATLNLLKNFYRDPTNYANHFRLHAGQLIIDVTYGLPVTSFEDPLIQLAERVLKTVSLSVSPMMWVLNPVPIVQALPSWLGGDNFARRFGLWKKELFDLQVLPYERTKANMASGDSRPSFTSSLLHELESKDGNSEGERLIRNTAAVAYGGICPSNSRLDAVSDAVNSWVRYCKVAIFRPTTSSDIKRPQSVAASTTFLLAMLLYSEAQVRAQKEIDSVVGQGRLPDFCDRPQLPYTTAIMKEVLRWHTPTPQGIPHLLTRDDHYRDYVLPAGCIVIGNIWGILHDPAVFEEPFEFRPERHLLPKSEQAAARMELFDRVAFGFGRRSCPGRLFAEDELWLMFAQFLAVYSVFPDPAYPPPKPEFCERDYESILGYFAHDSPDEQSFPAVPQHLGLKDDSEDRWRKFFQILEQLNASATPGSSYKFFLLARHGQGYHNVAELKYGTKAWNDYWAKLDGDGEITWGPDPLLTDLGQEQAKTNAKEPHAYQMLRRREAEGAIKTALARCWVKGPQTEMLFRTTILSAMGMALQLVTAGPARGSILKLSSIQEIRDWVAQTDADITYSGKPIDFGDLSKYNALDTTVVFCNRVTGTLWGPAGLVGANRLKRRAQKKIKDLWYPVGNPGSRKWERSLASLAGLAEYHLLNVIINDDASHTSLYDKLGPIRSLKDCTDTEDLLNDKQSEAYKAYFYQVHERVIWEHLEEFCPSYQSIDICHYWLSLPEEVKPAVVKTISRIIVFNPAEDLSDQERLLETAGLASAMVLLELSRHKRPKKNPGKKRPQFSRWAGDSILRKALRNAEELRDL